MEEKDKKDDESLEIDGWIKSENDEDNKKVDEWIGSENAKKNIKQKKYINGWHILLYICLLPYVNVLINAIVYRERFVWNSMQLV